MNNSTQKNSSAKVAESKSKAIEKAVALESAAYDAQIYGRHQMATNYRVRAFNLRQKYGIKP